MVSRVVRASSWLLAIVGWGLAGACGNDAKPQPPAASVPAESDSLTALSADARARAAAALGRTPSGSAKSVPLLAIALDAESEPVRSAAAAALAAIGRRALPAWAAGLASRKKVEQVAPGAFPDRDTVALFLALGRASTPADLGIVMDLSRPSERAAGLLAAAVEGGAGYANGEEEGFLRIGVLALDDPDASVRSAAETFLAVRGWGFACDRATSGGRPLPPALAGTDTERGVIRRLRDQAVEAIGTYATRLEGRVGIGGADDAPRAEASAAARTGAFPGRALIDALQFDDLDAGLAAAQALKRSDADSAAALKSLREVLANRSGKPPGQVAGAAWGIALLDPEDEPALQVLRELATVQVRGAEDLGRKDARRVALLALASRLTTASDRDDALAPISLLLAGPDPGRGIDDAVVRTAGRTVAASADAARSSVSDFAASLERARKMPRAKRPVDWSGTGPTTDAGIRWAEILLDVLGGLGARAKEAAATLEGIVASDSVERMRHLAARALRADPLAVAVPAYGAPRTPSRPRRT